MLSSDISASASRVDGSALGRYLPSDLAARLLAQPDSLSPQALQPHADFLADLLRVVSTYVPRKIVTEQIASPLPGRVNGRILPGTTLFSDVSGFTAMSEKLAVLGKAGAEEITRILNDLFTTLLDVITAYRGNLFKFGGDALTVFFEGHDHAWRAVAAAIDMQEQMRRFAELETLHGTFTLRMRVGVHTGPIFAAEVGLPDRVEVVVTGENINLTALAEEAAEPTQVAISTATLEQIRSVVRTRTLEDGFHQVEQLYERPRRSHVDYSARIYKVEPTAAGLVDVVQRVEALRPYLVAGLYDKIAVAPQRVEVEGELRLVTVLFANFYDFSEILKHLGEEGVEEATTLLNRYFTSMQMVLNQYGGTVNKVDMYTHGDKLMVLFGAPVAYENDPERAVYAALGMQEAMRDLAEIESSVGRLSLHQKIGINTGTVFAGNVGSPTRKEYTVMGDAVNLTARLMSAAQENQILISPSTWRRVRDLFDLQPLAPVRVKGKANPIPIYAVGGARERVRRERETGALGRAELVGRAPDMEVLRATADRTLEGRGQMLALMGEAGTGKSRLVEELESYLQALSSPSRVLYGECQSYGQSIAYLPFAGMFRQFFGITSADTPPQQVDKVARAVEELAPEYHAFIPLLGAFLSLPISENDVTRALGGEQRRARAFELIRTLLLQAAGAQPLLLILENLQWVDTSSLDLMNYLSAAIAEVPLLLLLVHRPEFTHPWSELPYYREVRLRELSEEDSVALVQSMLHMPELPESLRSLILQKSQGNPLFIEEVVKSLIEHQMLDQVDGEWRLVGDLSQVEIPDTIQGVIMARIDRLEERSRHVLQVASVIGRRFPFRVLDGVYPLKVDVQECLAGLSALDLISREGPADDPSYLFTHIMTQEVAYESMLFSRRREYHRKVGDCIEGVYAARLLENYELLAYHYEKGEHWPKALEYDVRAGDKARGQYANKEALQYFGRVLEVLDAPERYRLHLVESGGGNGDPTLTIPRGSAVVWRREALLGRGDVQALLGEFERALGDYDLALTYVEGSRSRADAYWRMAEVQQNRGQYALALERLDRAVAELCGDYTCPEAARARSLQALIFVRQGKFDQAEQAAMECLDTLEGSESYAELRASYNVLGHVNFRRGNWDQTIKYWQQGLALMEKMGDVREAAKLYGNLAAAYGQKGDLDATIDLLTKALKAFEKIGEVRAVAIVYNNLGAAYRTRGDNEMAADYYTQSLAINERIGDARVLSHNHANLAEVHRDLGDCERAMHHLEVALEIAERIGATESLPEYYRQLGETQLVMGNLDRAMDQAMLSLEHATRVGSRLEEGAACRVLGQIFARQGEWDQAREYFGRALNVLEEINQPRELAEAQYRYGVALREQGDAAAAREQLERAATFYRRHNDTYKLRAVEGAIKGMGEEEA